MKPWRVALVSLLAILVVAVIVVVDHTFSLAIGGTLAAAASAMLLWVTWLYVRTTRDYTNSTRDLVDLQREQNRLQARQAHFTAAAEIWATCFSVQEPLHEAELHVKTVGAVDTHVTARMLHERLQGVHERLDAASADIARALVNLEDDLESSAWKAVAALLTVVNHLLHLQRLLLTEANRSRDQGDVYRLQALIEEWETGESSLPRWSSVVDGSTIREAKSVISELSQACRVAVKKRADSDG